MSHVPTSSLPNLANRRCRPPNGQSLPRAGQRGVALVVALLLLVVITLVGLAAVRGTIMQQKMASNLFDRQIAFQSAEAAMRAAQARIAGNPGDIARNCQAGGRIGSETQGRQGE